MKCGTQLLLEMSRDSQLTLTIREYDPIYDQISFSRLSDEYVMDRRTPSLRHTLSKVFESDLPTYIRFIAYNLGEAVGFLAAEIRPPEALSNDHWERMTRSERQSFQQGHTIRVNHLHVIEHMHKAGVSRRLIRRIMEEGNNEELNGIWILRSEWTEEEQLKFQRSGFVRTAMDDKLWYPYLVNEN